MGVAGAVSVSVIASSPAAPPVMTQNSSLQANKDERSNHKDAYCSSRGVYSAKVSLTPFEGMKAIKPLAEGDRDCFAACGGSQ